MEKYYYAIDMVHLGVTEVESREKLILMIDGILVDEPHIGFITNKHYDFKDMLTMTQDEASHSEHMALVAAAVQHYQKTGDLVCELESHLPKPYHQQNMN